MQGHCRAEQGEEGIQPQEEGTQEGTGKIQMNGNAPFFADFNIKNGGNQTVLSGLVCSVFVT